MSDPTEGTTPSSDEVPPDPENPQDPGELQSAGDLDEDELGVDPLESGAEAPDDWSPVAAEPPTPREEREGESLDHRLREERPDQEEVEATPLAETRMYELDETVDERADAEVADSQPAELPEQRDELT